MSAVSVLFPKTKASIAKDKTGVGAIVFDATLTEVYTTNANVTQHPVEDGSNIVDHIQTQPIEVELVGVISNTPLPFVTTDVAVLRSFVTPKRAEDAYDRLVELQKSGELVILTTSLDTWDDMAITSVRLDRDPQTANVIKVSVSFREVIKSSALSLAKAIAKTAAKNAEKAKLGAKAAAKKAATAAPNISIAKTGLNLIRGGR